MIELLLSEFFLPLITPLAETKGGEAQVTLIEAAFKVVIVISSGGMVGAPSAVWTRTSSDMGPKNV
jgi:hypothetical protein